MSHWCTRYDEDGDPYGEVCHCGVDQDHDEFGELHDGVRETNAGMSFRHAMQELRDVQQLQGEA